MKITYYVLTNFENFMNNENENLGKLKIIDSIKDLDKEKLDKKKEGDLIK